jgi:uncharacterized protein
MGEAKHYLYRIQPKRSNMLAEGLTSHESETMAKHFAYLQQLTQQGILILAGRKLNNDEDTFGIAIIKVHFEEEARALMENDPAVNQGIMNTRLFPYQVALISEANVQ